MIGSWEAIAKYKGSKQTVRIFVKMKIFTKLIVQKSIKKAKEKTLCTYLPTVNAKRFL